MVLASNLGEQEVNQLPIDYELTESPIQAVGTIGDGNFYFHAAHSNWSFEVADDLGNLPSDTGENPVFRVEGRWPMVDHTMSREDAHRIISRCAAIFSEIGKV